MTELSSSPFRWYGSKSRLMSRLLPLIPNHVLYVSIFGGSGADIARKPRSRSEVYNDLQGNLTTFFRVVSDDELRRRLIARLNWLVPSRVIYEDMCRVCRDGHDDPVQIAAAVYYCLHWSYAGRDPAASSSFAIRASSPVPASWHSANRHLNAIARRFHGVLIENRPWQEVVAKFDGPNTFFYADPPYVAVTRKNVGHYKHEMTDIDHEALLTGLRTVRGLVMLSGYECDLYKRNLSGWRRKDFSIKSLASSTRSARLETVWMNYDAHGQRLPTKKGSAA